jgi:hypothetical protein
MNQLRDWFTVRVSNQLTSMIKSYNVLQGKGAEYLIN